MATNNSTNETQTGLQSMDANGVHNGRSITAGTNIAVTNGDGISGNPTVAVTAPFAATSLTANSLIVGNGTANVSALGAATNGQIPIGRSGNTPLLATLTAGTNISIANSSGQIIINSTADVPGNAKLSLFDDMLYGGGSIFTNGLLGNFGGVASLGASFGQSAISYTSQNQHPGIISLLTATAAASQVYILSNSRIILGGGAFTLEFCINIPALSNATNRYELWLGMSGFTPNPFPLNNDYVCLYYTDTVNSGRWVGYSRVAGVLYTVNSTRTVTTGWNTLQLTFNAAGTGVGFLQGANVAGLTSIGSLANVPTAAMGFGIQLNNSGGASATGNGIGVDYISAQQNLTTAR